MKKIVNKVIYSEMRKFIKGRENHIVYLYFDCGYTEQEIAINMNISQPMVNKIKQRALKKMNKIIT